MIWPGQASEHDTDHREADEGRSRSSVALEVTCEAAIVADPGEGSLDDPPFGQDDEAVELVSLDDLQSPGSCLGDRCGCLRSLVAGISEDAFDEGEEAARALIENELRPVAILHIGRVDNDVQQEAERVDKNMPLAARDLLARIEALRVERGAPF